MMDRVAEDVGYGREQMVKTADLKGKETRLSKPTSSAVPAVEVSGVGVAEGFYECLFLLCADAYVHVVGHQAICQEQGIGVISCDVEAYYAMDVISS